MNIIVTGGAGFIGSNFVFHMLKKYPDYRIICLDKLTYAGNLSTLAPVMDNPNFRFVKADMHLLDIEHHFTKRKFLASLKKISNLFLMNTENKNALCKMLIQIRKCMSGFCGGRVWIVHPML